MSHLKQLADLPTTLIIVYPFEEQTDKSNSIILLTIDSKYNAPLLKGKNKKIRVGFICR